MTESLQRMTGESDDAPDVPERRSSSRHATVFQVARIIVADRQELCILRNVSASGLKAEVYIDIAPQSHVTVELKTGHRLSGIVMWARDQFIGVQFAEPVPMMQMLGHCSMDERIARVRPPRLDTDLAGTLRDDKGDTPIRICNVSQGGMKLSVPHMLAVDTRVDIRAPELGWRRAIVRWWHEGEAGVMLAQPLIYPDFVAWRSALWRAHGGTDRPAV